MRRPGDVAEWLGRGLQSLVQRFESARRLLSASNRLSAQPTSIEGLAALGSWSLACLPALVLAACQEASACFGRSGQRETELRC